MFRSGYKDAARLMCAVTKPSAPDATSAVGSCTAFAELGKFELVAERGKRGRQPTDPETPVARRSSHPAPRPSQVPPRQSDFKTLLTGEAGRYSYAPAPQGLSVEDLALIAEFREDAPSLARLIAACPDPAEARKAFRELAVLLNRGKNPNARRR